MPPPGRERDAVQMAQQATATAQMAQNADGTNGSAANAPATAAMAVNGGAANGMPNGGMAMACPANGAQMAGMPGMQPGMQPIFPVPMQMVPVPQAGPSSANGGAGDPGGGAMAPWPADPAEHRKVRHNLAERRRTNRINKLFNQLYEVLISPEVLPILNEAGRNGQLRKLPRKSKAAVLEAEAVALADAAKADAQKIEAEKRSELEAPAKAICLSGLTGEPPRQGHSLVRPESRVPNQGHSLVRPDGRAHLPGPFTRQA